MTTEKREPITMRILPNTRRMLQHAAIDQGMRPGALVDELTRRFLDKLTAEPAES